MSYLEIGDLRIPYTVLRSAHCKRRRIEVTPETVTAILPENGDEITVPAFLHKNRKWIFEKREELRKQVGFLGPWPSRFVSGAKVMYRGRRMKLLVKRSDLSRGVKYSHGFHVLVPPYVKEGYEERYVKKTLTAWLRDRVKADAEQFASHYGKYHDLIPEAIRIKDQKHLWGSCGKDGIINLNWRLIFAPKPVLEYAVVHELCHLRYRNHGPDFWNLVRTLLPDYEVRKKWLEDNEKDVGKEG